MRSNTMFTITPRKLINAGYFLLILSCVAAIDHWWPLTVLAIIAWVGWLIPAAIWFARRPALQLLRRRRPSGDRPFGAPPRPIIGRDDTDSDQRS